VGAGRLRGSGGRPRSAAWWWIRKYRAVSYRQPDGIGAAGKKAFFGKPRPGFTTEQFIPKILLANDDPYVGWDRMPEHPLLSVTLCWVGRAL